MTDTSLRLLFSPIQVGKLTLRNRIVFLPHSHNYPVDELPGEREAEYFAERAKGGVGLIIYGTQYVHRTGCSPWVNASDPRVVERYKRITDMVHQHGAYISAQLMHGGSRHSYSEVSLAWRMPYGPSSRLVEGTMTREMDQDDIQRAIEGYQLAARHVKEGGFDGIQIRMNSGLTQEFTSPLANERKDEYGGTVENRCRFSLDVVGAVRDEVGSDMIMDVRVSGDQVDPNGYGVEGGQEIARIMAGSGKIDFITTAIGGAGGASSSLYVQGPYPLPQGYGVYASEAIKKVVDLPVVAQGRVNDPIQAEEILARGQGDLIGMARGLIADAEFPNKAREGRLNDIRKCIGYHEVCQGRNLRQRPITCVHNPAAGREKELGMGTLRPAPVKKKVMVIGGGPAGLKLAEVAALRGHQVTLYEKAEELGGQNNLAKRLPHREHLEEITDHVAGQLEKLGVEVRLGTEVTPEMVQASGADAVVVATGSLPMIPSIPGADQENVVTYWDVARDQGARGDTILIYDLQGYWPAAGAAELLAGQGKTVHIVTPQTSVGADIHPLTLLLWQQRVQGKGIISTTDATLKAISGNTVTLSSAREGDQEWTIDGVDTVVLACGAIPNDALYKSLKEKVKGLHIVGDCEAPLKLERGIYSAELLGRAL